MLLSTDDLNFLAVPSDDPGCPPHRVSLLAEVVGLFSPLEAVQAEVTRVVIGSTSDSTLGAFGIVYCSLDVDIAGIGMQDCSETLGVGASTIGVGATLLLIATRAIITMLKAVAIVDGTINIPVRILLACPVSRKLHSRMVA